MIMPGHPTMATCKLVSVRTWWLSRPQTGWLSCPGVPLKADGLQSMLEGQRSWVLMSPKAGGSNAIDVLTSKGQRW